MLLEGKVAVVYGGGGVIGGACARAFAREGAHVVVAGRTRAALDAVAADVGNVAAFAASDRARTVTGATVNASAGALLD